MYILHSDCAICFMLLPFQGVGVFNAYTQGAALGYVLIGLSARIACLWLARIVCQWLSARMFVFLLHEYHEILAGRPEYLRVVDAQHILLVGILLQGVRT